MYLVLYEDDGSLYQAECPSYEDAEACARDCAENGMPATVVMVMREFSPRPPLPLEVEYGLRPGVDYPASFGGACRRRLAS